MKWELAKARLENGFIVRRKKWVDGHYWIMDEDGRIYATRPYIGGYVNLNYYVPDAMIDEAAEHDDWQYYKQRSNK